MIYGGYFVPPQNFGFVEENLSRSAQPNVLNFPFMEKLKLKTIIFMSSEEPYEELRVFADTHDINIIHLGQFESGNNPGNPISEDTVLKSLEIILNTKHYPLHIMCTFGRHRTGTVVGCLRKLQRWNLTSIFEEYRRYTASKVRPLILQFIEFFDTDLVSYAVEGRPQWL